MRPPGNDDYRLLSPDGFGELTGAILVISGAVALVVAIVVPWLTGVLTLAGKALSWS